MIDESGKEESRKAISRRHLLTALAGGAAATAMAAAGVTKIARAADGDPLIIGQINSGSSQTSLSADLDSLAVVSVRNEAINTLGVPETSALQGIADNGTGVRGDGIVGVSGVSTSIGRGAGIAGSGDTIGVSGFSASNEGNGVRGVSDPLPQVTQNNAFGVFGESKSFDGVGVGGLHRGRRSFIADGPGIGVLGRSTSIFGGRGVLGMSSSLDGAGVEAQSVDFSGNPISGVGLRVIGRSQFNTIVDGTILSGQDGATVADSRIKTNSEVIVMLAGDPGFVVLGMSLSGSPRIRNAISWVNVAAGSFTVTLLGRAAVNVPFKAFIAEKTPS